MKKVGIIIGIVVVVVIVIVLVVIKGPLPNPFIPSSTFEPITFTGLGDKTTSPFEITTREWIIDWSYVPNYEYLEYAAFSFFIYPRGETVDFVEMVFLPQNTWGTTYSYAGPGKYYLKVICGNVESWEITIRPA